MIKENERQSRLALHTSMQSVRRAEGSHRLLAGALVIAVGLGISLFRHGMGEQMREDAAVGAGYSSYSEYETMRDEVYPTDEYSYRIQSFADEMCRCEDLACARDVEVRYIRFVRTGGAPGDDRAEKSVQQDGTRLADCQATHETAVD